MKSRINIFISLFVILLFSCASPAALPPPINLPPVTATLTPINVPALPSPVPPPSITPTPLPRIERVLIVSFDGLRPDAIAAAEMDNVIALMQSGAYTLTAQTIMPSVTLPSHASMLVGTCPAKHIVRWNEYVPENGFAIGTDIFDLVHSAGLQTIMLAGKEKLSQITEPTSLDFYALVDETDKKDDPYSIEELAIEHAIRGFNLMFVHFPNGDLQGHEYGWMSHQQLRAYARDDVSLGHILDALKQIGAYDTTIIIITSDHGGHETTHGYNVPEDMTIPWIISGPRVLPAQITTQVHTMDTAATTAFVLGLPLPPEWDGVPVFEAFGLPISAYSESCH